MSTRYRTLPALRPLMAGIRQQHGSLRWLFAAGSCLAGQATATTAPSTTTPAATLTSGVHAPQDIMAGRVLGTVLAHDFLASPALQKDMHAATRELAQAGLAAVNTSASVH